jgi:hypothetical protein
MYYSTGWYRSGYNCIMRTLGAPYCQVPSQSFVLKLYRGGWDVSGISLIEPGSISPAGPDVALPHPSEQVFHAETLSPVGGPPSQITWLVDGIPVPGETSNSFTFKTEADMPALVHLTLRVKDVTPLVAPEMAGDALQGEYTWNIQTQYFIWLPLIEAGAH